MSGFVPCPPALAAPRAIVVHYANDSGLDTLLNDHSLCVEGRRWLGRVCWDSIDLFEQLPVSLVKLLVPEAGFAAAEAARAHLRNARGGLPMPRFPRTVSAPDRRPVPEALRLTSPTFAGSFVPNPVGMLGIEGLAAGRTDYTAERLAAVLESIFNERSWVTSMNNTAAPGEVPYYTFVERCNASGVSHLVPAISIDRTAPGAAGRAWDEAPRKRIAILRRELQDGPVGDPPISAIRHQRLLSIEAGMLLQLQSIRASYNNTVSGLRAWGDFCNAVYPLSPHFPACDSSIMAFACIFRNPGTFSQYHHHIRKGEDLLRIVSVVSSRVVGALKRGLNAPHVARPMPRLHRADVRRLVAVAVDEEDYAAARLYVACYSFLFRVANECLPLQANGRAGISDSDTRWHSQVEVAGGVATVTLRSRKNSRSGAVLIRRCGCRSRPSLLCGACAMGAQVVAAVASGRGPSDPIFGSGPGVSLAALQRRCLALGLPRCGWHAFRRGGAEDMVLDGQPLGFVLHAGGWRSAAFLRYITRENLATQAAYDALASMSDSD